MKKINFKENIFTFDHSKLDEMGFMDFKRFSESYDISEGIISTANDSNIINKKLEGYIYKNGKQEFFVAEDGDKIYIHWEFGEIVHTQVYIKESYQKVLKLHDIIGRFEEVDIAHRKISNNKFSMSYSYIYFINVHNGDSIHNEREIIRNHNVRFGNDHKNYEKVNEIIKDPLSVNEIYDRLKEALPKLNL